MSNLSVANLNDDAYRVIKNRMATKDITVTDGLNLAEMAKIAEATKEAKGEGIQFDYEGRSYTISLADFKKMAVDKNPGGAVHEGLQTMFDAAGKMLRGGQDVMVVVNQAETDRSKVADYMTFTKGTFAPGTIASGSALDKVVQNGLKNPTKPMDGLQMADLDADASGKIDETEVVWFTSVKQEDWGGDFQAFKADYKKAEAFVKSGFNHSNIEDDKAIGKMGLMGRTGEIKPDDYLAYIKNVRDGAKPEAQKLIRAELKKENGGKTPSYSDPAVMAEFLQRTEAKIDELVAKEGKLLVKTEPVFDKKGARVDTRIMASELPKLDRIVVAAKAYTGLGRTDMGYCNGVIGATMAAANEANKKYAASQGSQKIVTGYERVETPKTELVGYKETKTFSTEIALTFPEVEPDWIGGQGKAGDELTSPAGRPLIPVSDWDTKTKGHVPLTEGGLNRKLMYNNYPTIMPQAAQYDFKNLTDVITMPGVGDDKFVDLMVKATGGKIKPAQVKQFLVDVRNMNGKEAVQRTQQFMQDFALSFPDKQLVPFADTLAKNGANKGVDGWYGTATAATFQEFSAILKEVVTTNREPVYKTTTTVTVKPIVIEQPTTKDVEIPVYVLSFDEDVKKGDLTKKKAEEMQGLDRSDFRDALRYWGGSGGGVGTGQRVE